MSLRAVLTVPHADQDVDEHNHFRLHSQPLHKWNHAN